MLAFGQFFPEISHYFWFDMIIFLLCFLCHFEAFMHKKQEITKMLNIVNEERLMTVHIVANHLLANLQEGKLYDRSIALKVKERGNFPTRDLMKTFRS